MPYDDPYLDQDSYDRNQLRLAFAIHRDHFREMTDEQYERDIMIPMAKGLYTLMLRGLLDDLPHELGERVMDHVFGKNEGKPSESA